RRPLLRHLRRPLRAAGAERQRFRLLPEQVRQRRWLRRLRLQPQPTHAERPGLWLLPQLLRGRVHLSTAQPPRVLARGGSLIPMRRGLSSHPFWLLLILAPFLLPACASHPGSPLPGRGDEIMVCGLLFHTGAPVILWTDPGGYDAYRVERRFVTWDKAGWDATAADTALKS